ASWIPVSGLTLATPCAAVKQFQESIPMMVSMASNCSVLHAAPRGDTRLGRLPPAGQSLDERYNVPLPMAFRRRRPESLFTPRRLLDQGLYDLADVELEHALELSPRNATANLLSGRLLSAQGRMAKAIEQFAAALQLAPRSEEARAALARAQEAKSRGSLPYI